MTQTIAKTRDGKEIHYLSRSEVENAPGFRASHGGRKGRSSCLMHGGDNPAAMETDFETGWIRCFTAGCVGRLSDHPDTYGAHGDERPRFVPRPTPPPPPPPDPAKMAGLRTALDRASQRLPGSPGAAYLERRNISPDLTVSLGLGWSTSGDLANRLVFPLTTPDGVPTSATGRAVVDSRKPKYLNLDAKAGYPKGWFNADAIARVKASGNPLYVCEGPFDALALIAGGLEDSVAILGVDDFRPTWLLGVRKLVVCFDADEKGQEKRADFAFKAAGIGAEVSLLSPDALEGCKDLAEYWQQHGTLPPALVRVPTDPAPDNLDGWWSEDFETMADMEIGPNAPATHTPPTGCIASRFACPILGACDRHLAGEPCQIPVAQDEAA